MNQSQTDPADKKGPPAVQSRLDCRLGVHCPGCRSLYVLVHEIESARIQHTCIVARVSCSVETTRNSVIKRGGVGRANFDEDRLDEISGATDRLGSAQGRGKL